MAQFSTKVIAYYTPPKDEAGVQPPAERHELWQIDYEEAKRGKEGACWSLQEPKKGTDVEDKVPVPVDLTMQGKSSPPPVIER